MKYIEKTESTIEILEKEIYESDVNNHGLLTNLKKSIQNDEEAVKTLTRKTAILNLISQWIYINKLSNHRNSTNYQNKKSSALIITV